MFSDLRQSGQSRYGRAIAKLASGQIAAAAIPFLAAPILGRIYSPSEYGVLGLYVACVAVLAGASTLQYHNGVFAVRSERQAEAIAGIALSSSLLVGAITALIVLGIWLLWGTQTAFGDDFAWMLLLPLSVLSSSVILTGEVVLNRRQRYGSLARLLVLSAAVMAAVTIWLGLAGWSVAGIMVGYLAGEIVRTTGYAWHLRSLGVRPFRLGLQGQRRLGARHSAFPRFSLPATMISSLILQLPVLALGFVGASALLGAFTRAQRLVSVPFSLLGTAISQVFRQTASADYRDTGTCRPIYRRTAALLAALGFGPIAVLMVFGPQIFVLYLGPKWAIAGEIAQVLAPAIWLRMIAAPMEAVLQFTGNQEAAFRYNIFFLLALLIGTAGPYLASRDEMLIVWGFSIVSCLFYCISLALTWRAALRAPR